MKIEKIAAEIERIAPLKLAQGWDNVGLLVGDSEKNIKRILMTIDVTKAVIAEARKSKTDLILSYHPVIWDGLKRVTADGESAVIYELIRLGICVYSIHTAFDVAMGGVNDQLADILGLKDAEPIGDYVESPEGPGYKLIVFVPARDLEKVSNAIFAAGAGEIGNYSNCGFQVEGQGSFLPLEGANPTLGKKGEPKSVIEVRFESVVSADKITAVVEAMRRAHPYETPAFDVVRHYDVENKFGLGRIGKVSKPRSLSEIIKNVKKVTGAKAVGIVGKEKRTVRTAAVCAGSCGKIINTVIARRCDLYLTGELKHHQALAAQEAGLTCICLSHTVSERFALKNFAKQLKKQLKDVTISISKKDADPFKWKNI